MLARRDGEGVIKVRINLDNKFGNFFVNKTLVRSTQLDRDLFMVANLVDIKLLGQASLDSLDINTIQVSQELDMFIKFFTHLKCEIPNSLQSIKLVNGPTLQGQR